MTNNFELDFSEDLCFCNYEKEAFKALDSRGRGLEGGRSRRLQDGHPRRRAVDRKSVV